MDNEKIERIIEEQAGNPAALIQVLLDIQEEAGWLSRSILETASEKLGVPISKVMHEATFFKALDTDPAGSHEIHVCNGTSCHARGAAKVLKAVQSVTGIGPGEPDPELKFTLKAVTCMGRCSSGPSMEVDGRHYGELDPAKAEEALKNCD